jgi:hypothetical protein
MAFDWWDFFALAEELSKSPSNEAGARTAISRYYYACHNVAKPQFYLQHAELWNAYKDHADFRYKQIGVKGDRLREARVSADYKGQLGVSVTAELTSARVIATSLRTLLEKLAAGSS